MEHSRVLHISVGHGERVDNAKSRVAEMTQAIEDAAQKATKDAQKIKELQETNEAFLHKYQENERHL